MFDTYTFQVIGILDKEMYIANSEIIAELDHYIVMPSFYITDEDVFTEGIQIHYANKVSVLLRVDRENEHVFKKEIQPLLESGMSGKFSWQVSPVEIAFRNVFKMDLMTSMTILIVLIIASAVVYLYCLLRWVL